MAIRQLVKEGVKGKFVCLPVWWGWRGDWQSPSLVLHLPPAIAGTEKHCCSGYGIFGVAWGWAFKQW